MAIDDKLIAQAQGWQSQDQEGCRYRSAFRVRSAPQETGDLVSIRHH